MRNNILTLLAGFVVMFALVSLFKLGLDKMTDANAAEGADFAEMNVDLNRRAILYRVNSGDTLWSLAERFYGAGRRWPEIARANDIAPGQGLLAGSIIRIPLAPGDAAPEAEASPAPQPLSYDDVEAAVLPGRFAVDDDVVGVALCRLNREQFPQGALCVARAGEAERVTVSLYDADGKPDAPALAAWEAPRGSQLAELRADDIDGDGEQELCTIWHDASGSPTSRVLRMQGDRLELASETPDDPVALLRLRLRDGQ